MKKRKLLCPVFATVLGATLGCLQMPGGDGTGGDGTGGDGATTFSAVLSGDQEVPPIVVSGSGSATFTLSADQTELTFEMSASGLTGPLAAAHLHNAAAGVNGAIVFSLMDFITDIGGQITISGSTRLSEWTGVGDALGELQGGNIYVNLHTADHPPGELRGQVIADP